MSATDDKYAKDADVILDELLRLHGEFGHHFIHKRYEGGHGLTQERYDFIIKWFTSWGVR